MSTNGNGKLPYLAFYPRDFLLDPIVEAMNMTEVGCYITLLCKAWEQQPVGTLPCDDHLLARYCRMLIKEWELCKNHVLKAFYFGDDSRWHQKRMEAEYAKVLLAHQARMKGGLKSAAQRKLSSSSVPTELALRASVSVSDSDSSEKNDEVQEKKEKPKKSGRKSEPRPESFQQMKEFALSHGMTESDAKYCWSRWEVTGWRISGRAIRDWRHAMLSWKLAGYLPSTKEVKNERGQRNF